MELTAARSARASLIREHGMQVGLALKPGTPHEAVAPYVDLIDMVPLTTAPPSLTTELRPSPRQPPPQPPPHPNPRRAPTLTRCS